MSTRQFKDKTIMVTGGASGIGLATALAFGGAGSNIVLVDMDEVLLNKQAAEFSERGIPVLAVTCDVAREDACIRAVEKAVATFGSIDLLFNNAGITQRSLFEHTRVSVIEKVMSVNFFGSVNMTRAALPHIIESRGMIIVNESIAGVAPLVGRCGYAASKHAMHGFFTSLRCELRHRGVHVMIVCPGFIKTNLQTRALGGDGNIATHAQTRIGRQQTPEAVAAGILKGAQRECPMMVFTLLGKLGYLVSRFWPAVYERLMTRQFKQELG